MAKGTKDAQALGRTKEFNRTLVKGDDNSKWNQPPVEVTREMILTPTDEILVDAWYTAARKAVTDAEATDPKEAREIYENFVLGAEDVRTVRASDVSDSLAKQLKAASAEDLAALKIRFIG